MPRRCSDASTGSQNPPFLRHGSSFFHKNSGSGKRLPLIRGYSNSETMTWMQRTMSGQGYETIMGVFVLLNFFSMTVETHARATDDRHVLMVCTSANRIILGIYTVESCLRFYLQKCKSFTSMWNNLDYAVVLGGIAGELLEFTPLPWVAQNQMGMLKSLRMIRLVRLLRLLVAFPELHILVVGISGCMKTLFWATCLIFSSLNVWSILSVEYLSPITEEIDDAGKFTTCDWCRTAFANIWLANLTWFQIVSGDGWSILARSMIETYPWALLFFVSIIVVVMWGLLNLVVAAIVEASMQAREKDIASAAKLAVLREDQAFEALSLMCKAMDRSGDGIISIDEFIEFYKSSDELREYLASMGVTEASLGSLLKLMDLNQNGTLENEEFIAQMTRIRTLVVKTEIFNVVRYVENIHVLLSRQGRVLEQVLGCKTSKLGHSSSPKYFGRQTSHCSSSDGLGSIASSQIEVEAQGETFSSPKLFPSISSSTLHEAPSQIEVKTYDNPVLSPEPETTIPCQGANGSAAKTRASIARSTEWEPCQWHVFEEELQKRAQAMKNTTAVPACISPKGDQAPQDHSGRAVDEDLALLMDELDKRFEVIMKRFDELPEVLARHVLSSVRNSSCPTLTELRAEDRAGILGMQTKRQSTDMRMNMPYNELWPSTDSTCFGFDVTPQEDSEDSAGEPNSKFGDDKTKPEDQEYVATQEEVAGGSRCWTGAEMKHAWEQRKAMLAVQAEKKARA